MSLEDKNEILKKEAIEFVELKLDTFLKKHADDIDEIDLDFSFHQLTSSPFSCVCKVLLEGWIYGVPYSKRAEASRSPWGEILFFFVPGTMLFTIFIEITNFFTRRRTGEIKESKLVFQCVDTVSDRLLVNLIKKINLTPSLQARYWRFFSMMSWVSTGIYFLATAVLVKSFMDPFAGMFWNDLLFSTALSIALSFFFYRAMRCLSPLCMSGSFFKNEAEGKLYIKLAKIKHVFLMKTACLVLLFLFLLISSLPYMLYAIKP